MLEVADLSHWSLRGHLRRFAGWILKWTPLLTSLQVLSEITSLQDEVIHTFEPMVYLGVAFGWWCCTSFHIRCITVEYHHLRMIFCPYFQPAMICKSQVLVCASVCHSWRQPWGILPASGLTRTPSCFWGELLRPQNGWHNSHCKIATGTVPYLSLPITPTSNSTHSLEQLPHRRSYPGSPSRLFIIWLNPKRPVFVKVSNQQIFWGLFFLAVVSLTSTGIGRRGLLWTNWWFWEVLRQDEMWHPWMGGCFLGSRHKWQ